jgi:hypothetical protein
LPSLRRAQKLKKQRQEREKEFAEYEKAPMQSDAEDDDDADSDAGQKAKPKKKVAEKKKPAKDSGARRCRRGRRHATPVSQPVSLLCARRARTDAALCPNRVVHSPCACRR